MYPSWGNYGPPPAQSYGGPGSRKPPVGAGQAPGAFGGFEAPSSGSVFSSLQEQHRQQMQQLQMLHQKQLQSVLHHGNSGPGFGGGPPGPPPGPPGPPWHAEGPGQAEGGESAQPYLMQERTPIPAPRGPLPPKHAPPQPPPQAAESKPALPPPEPQPPKPQEKIGAPEASNTSLSTATDNSSVPLQEQQNVWYKQHLQNLQKLRQEKAKQNQKEANAFQPPPPPTSQAAPPPPPSEPPKGAPPPPPPKEEPPVPPPPPSEAARNSTKFTDTPDTPKDPEEAARLQQLQAAAAHWQQVQQQRVTLQYQALMQQHEKLQQLLEQYQQLIQQPPNLQTMSAELQLRHYEMQQQQFMSLFQNWNSSFALWQEQFQSYPHKDQLQDYELQWKQWQEQMNATNTHLAERVATITAMVPFASGQYSAMMGQFAQYPGQEMQMQQQVVNPVVQPPPVAAGAMAPGAAGATPPGQPPPTLVAHSESSEGPSIQGSLSTGVGVMPPGPMTAQTPSFNSISGQRPSRFDQPPKGFDGPPKFDQSQQRFDGPPRFELPQQRFDGPTRFNQPPQRFDGPPRFDQPRQRFDGPPRFDQPPPRFERPPRFDQPPPRFEPPPRFDQPRQRFDGPPRFDQPPPRFDGPPRFDQPRPRFDGPPRFDQPRQRFENPLRHDQPQFGQQSRLDSTRPFGPPPHFESPSPPPQKKQQSPQPKLETDIQSSASTDSTKAPVQPQPDKDKKLPNKATAEDLTDDNLLGVEGFFIPDDPIPQKISDTDNSSADKSNDKSVTDDGSKDKPGTVTEASASVPKPQPPPQNSQKDHGLLTNNKTPSINKTAEIQPESQASAQLVPIPEPPKLPPGRGRGQPPLRGLGRGQLGPGQFKEHNTAETEEEMGEMPDDYMQLEEDTGIAEDQQDYWQDPSYKGFGNDESEMPPEDTWMPEEHYFEEEEYYEEPMAPHMGRGRPPMRGGPPIGRGGPPMGRGGPLLGSGPPIGRGGPPMGRGYPPMGRGGPPMGRGGPPMGRGGPPMGRGGPPMGRGGPPMGRGYPPMGRGGPPMGRGGPPMGRGGPPMGRGYPPMGRGGPPMGRGGPPMGRGGPPMGRGGVHMGRGGPSVDRGDPDDMHWGDTESAECSEEGNTYWEEWQPQMRGMRPPFPPGRGRPPRGHPGFMPRGRGGPLHPAHGEMGHEPVGHEMGLDDTDMDQSTHPMYPEHDPYGHPRHLDVGRGRQRVPPPPHEMMERLEEPLYDGGEEDSEWYPHERGPPMPPHEIIDRGGIRRRPMGRGMARGMWRPGPNHEECEEVYDEDYAADYDHGDEGYRRPPAPEYRSDDHHEAKYYESEWDRDRALPEREYPPRLPPPPHLREERWNPEIERRHLYPYDENDRGRGERQILEYRDEPPYRLEESPHSRASDWERRSPLPVRAYPDYNDRPQYDERKEEPPHASSVTDVPVSSVEAATHEMNRANVLALSQRQHEIILKAAQELKQIRELQVGKTPNIEKQPSDVLPDLPAGLLGLEIPPDVRNVLKGMTAAVQSAPTESTSWESKPAASAVDYQSSLSASVKPSLMPKTVDYAHGHELGATVERISYGERIVLRPDPVPSDRIYEKEPLGLRDSYSRDLYHERRSDPYLDRREYSRERELYREPPSEYERDRYERERYHSRERDDRSPLGPRSAYRERDKERSASRDPDDYYGRPSYDRPLYERSGPDRMGPDRMGPDRMGPDRMGPDRMGPERYSSPYMERRGYPEDRGPHPAAPLPPPPPPPRVEKKPEIKNIDDILKAPGRLSRPERIVIIMRGLPGSGKSHVAKLIRDKEVECGGAPPRVLVLDDYFMTEVEKVEKDPDTGKRVKTKVLEYEYEPEMEDTYRSSMLKTFKKTLDDGFFPFIILDTINDRVKHFEQFWSAAKTKGFEVYVAEITADTQTCSKRNVHGRTLKDITKMSKNWESSPRHMVRLDVRSLLQDAAIEEVEMEDFNPEEVPQETKREEEEESDLMDSQCFSKKWTDGRWRTGYIPKSKWEMDTSEAKLDKLDGLVSGGKRKRDSEHLSGLEDYLQLPDDYATRTSAPGKKRVRWADLEEQKDADRKRAIGFVVGQTDWEKITDESGQFAQRALNRTKYF
ncbi:YLP motif-containing protein 1 isoform X2 [Fundulus heteroclitus]|uniref:YLP motif-containing protein 1 isoform X2 n=1 Tax=Fundulus heteroclitus TaxID=8078 RepID=UPI00165C3C24|nr:YLP motif-containing protein 1 isoform X2 [Fundulus heteroclitus]